MNHLESEVPGWIVDRCDIHDRFILTLCVIPKECQDGDDRGGDDVDGELVLVNRELLDEFGQTSGEVLAILVERGVETGGLQCRVYTSRLAEGCS